MSERVITFDRLKSLVEKYSVINSNISDPDTLLNSLLESVKYLVKCDSAYLLLPGKDKKSFEFAISLGSRNTEIKKYTIDYNSIAGWVSETKEALIVNDVNKDHRFYDKIQEKTQYRIRNMIAFPLVIERDCVGVIEVVNKLDDLDFMEDDLALVEIFGQQASIAYKNAISLKNSRDQLSVYKNAIQAGKG